MLVVVIVIDYSVGLLLRRRGGLQKERVTGASRKLYNEGLLKTVIFTRYEVNRTDNKNTGDKNCVQNFI